MNTATKTCTVDDCSKALIARGLCSMHYARLRKTGSLDLHATRYRLDPCSVDGCDGKHYAAGWCRKHYGQWRKGIQPSLYKSCLHCGEAITDRNAGAELHTDCVALRQADQRYQRNFGMSLDRYNAISKYQRNRCAICGTNSSVLHVDHDHVSNAVRGLLCGSCNRGLGLYKDLTEILQAAIDYLRMPPTMRMAFGQKWGY